MPRVHWNRPIVWGDWEIQLGEWRKTGDKQDMKNGRTGDDVVGAGEEQSGAQVEAIDEHQGQNDRHERAKVAHRAAQVVPDAGEP